MSAVRPFRNDDIARCRCNLVLELVPVLSGPVGGRRRRRVMTDVNDSSIAQRWPVGNRYLSASGQISLLNGQLLRFSLLL